MQTKTQKTTIKDPETGEVKDTPVDPKQRSMYDVTFIRHDFKDAYTADLLWIPENITQKEFVAVLNTNTGELMHCEFNSGYIYVFEGNEYEAFNTNFRSVSYTDGSGPL